MTTLKSLFKNCSRCGQYKSNDQFQVRKASHDGLTAACKVCLAEYDAKRYKENPSRRDHAYACSLSPAGVRAKRMWVKRNPQKRAAHVMLGNAVRDGKISKPSVCTHCGEGGHIEGHHDDYTKPLSVVWLCKKCHIKEHREGSQ